jgi:hypothetical protein
MYLRFGARPRRAYVPQPVPEPANILAGVTLDEPPAAIPTPAAKPAPAAPPTPAAPAPTPAPRYIRRRPKSFSRYTPPPKAVTTTRIAPPTQPLDDPAEETHEHLVTSSHAQQQRLVASQAHTTTQPQRTRAHDRLMPLATFEPPGSMRSPFNSPPPVLLVGNAPNGHPQQSAAAAITTRKRRAPDGKGCVSCGIRSRWHTSNKSLN